MANHASAIKRIRSSTTQRVRNRYQHKTTRTFIKKLQQSTSSEEAQRLYPQVCSLLDKLAKRHILHRNKVARKKSQLALHLNQLLAQPSAPSPPPKA